MVIAYCIAPGERVPAPPPATIAAPATISEQELRAPNGVKPPNPFGMGKRKVVAAGEGAHAGGTSKSGIGLESNRVSWSAAETGNWNVATKAFGGLSSMNFRCTRKARRLRKGVDPGECAAMKELLEIVSWNDEKEIDYSKEMCNDKEDEDDDLTMMYIKQAMAKEQVVRAPRRVKEDDVNNDDEKATNKMSAPLSVSNLRFKSMLRLESTKDIKDSSSITRFGQRTTTMDKAFQGLLDDNCETEGSASVDDNAISSDSSMADKAADDDNFWDDVEF